MRNLKVCTSTPSTLPRPKRPFAGQSHADVSSAILRDSLPSVEILLYRKV
jgi:hypothetical protein